jgi:hypothetical protein
LSPTSWTLGIGSFATTTTLFKLTQIVPDERLPGALNGGTHATHDPPSYPLYSVERGNPLFSAYHTHAGDELWVITYRQFSTTTILLPEEY